MESEAVWETELGLELGLGTESGLRLGLETELGLQLELRLEHRLELESELASPSNQLRDCPRCCWSVREWPLQALSLIRF